MPQPFMRCDQGVLGTALPAIGGRCWAPRHQLHDFKQTFCRFEVTLIASLVERYQEVIDQTPVARECQ